MPVSTCLIEKNPLFREGLRSILSETLFQITQDYPDLGSMEANIQQKKNADLIIIGSDEKTAPLDGVVCQIRTCYPQGRILILTAGLDIKHVLPAFTAGVDGYLLRDISPQVLLGSLNMLMLGEKIYPASILSMLLHGAGDFKSEVPPLEPLDLSGQNLSARQRQILKCLVDGKTNKQIAIHLNITEATVKVHIKTVLRKLSVTNRTQAAIWALNGGLTLLTDRREMNKAS